MKNLFIDNLSALTEALEENANLPGDCIVGLARCNGEIKYFAFSGTPDAKTLADVGDQLSHVFSEAKK
jgi:hypothetical protein